MKHSRIIILLLLAVCILIGGMIIFHKHYSRNNAVNPEVSFQLATSTPNRIDLKEKTFWVIDDKTNKIYHISNKGALLSSLEINKEAGWGLTSVECDNLSNSLWLTLDLPIDTIYNINKENGKIISIINAEDISKEIKEIEGFAIDYSNNTFWLIDDGISKIYNINFRGEVISYFGSYTVDSEANSIEALAIDALDNTLWITDNNSDKVYHITKTGELLSFFSAAEFDAALTNIQGIAVDNQDNTLWITARANKKIYNVTKNGELLSVLNTVDYDGRSMNVVDICIENARDI